MTADQASSQAAKARLSVRVHMACAFQPPPPSHQSLRALPYRIDLRTLSALDLFYVTIHEYYLNF